MLKRGKKMNRTNWYYNPEIMYNIVNTCKSREITFLSKEKNLFTVRNIFANHSNYLKSNFQAFKFIDRPYNIYYSLAKYDNMSPFSYHPAKRKEQQCIFNKNALKHIVAYDWGLDFDGEGIEQLEEAYNDCKLVKSLFDKYGVPYTLKFSGSKGFHLKVPYEYLPKRLKLNTATGEDNIYDWLKGLAELLVFKFELHTLDLGIFDPRRIWKADYSYVCETGLISLPLNDLEFLNWHIDLVKPEVVIRTPLRNRGEILRKSNSEGLKKLCYEEFEYEY